MEHPVHLHTAMCWDGEIIKFVLHLSFSYLSRSWNEYHGFIYNEYVNEYRLYYLVTKIKAFPQKHQMFGY